MYLFQNVPCYGPLNTNFLHLDTAIWKQLQMWNLFQKWPLLINVEEQTSLKTPNVTLMT